MQIKKVFNNNVVLAQNEWDQEMVVMGRGLAFQKKAGETIDTAKIEKTFVLEKRGVSDKLAKLLRDTSELYLNIASKILDYAKSQLSYKLDGYLYVDLADHMSFAIKRPIESTILAVILLRWEKRLKMASKLSVIRAGAQLTLSVLHLAK